ncbi:hypothetical protein [Streptomyces sp. NBC_01353]|uniref:hypothetical protein n=1 Tax=Streptomyces sp. NBC_01353 TaxID=2903835 RepID=UPI002E2FBD8D|nr:hypothetical protein [Streptomyces sp. NBC_01353]
MSSDNQDERDAGTKRRTELLWRIGIAITLVAFAIFLISIYEDPGPVCGTGQDKGPC